MARPIQFTPTSDKQRAEIVAYAKVKGFQNASALALFATENYMSRVGLTAKQEKEAEVLVKEILHES